MNIERLLIKEKRFKLYNTINIKITELKRGRLENHMAKDNEHICMKTRQTTTNTKKPNATPKEAQPKQVNKNSIY